MRNLIMSFMLLAGGSAYAAQTTPNTSDAAFAANVERGISASVQQIRDRGHRLAAQIFDALKGAPARCDRSMLPTCHKTVGQVAGDTDSGLQCLKQTNLRTRELLQANCRLQPKHDAEAIWKALDAQVNCVPMPGGPCAKYVGGLSCNRSSGTRVPAYSCKLSLPK